MYASGLGVAKNTNEAIRHYKAAVSSEPRAQRALPRIYSQGNGGNSDPNEASRPFPRLRHAITLGMIRPWPRSPERSPPPKLTRRRPTFGRNDLARKRLSTIQLVKSHLHSLTWAAECGLPGTPGSHALTLVVLKLLSDHVKP
jgi:TPR repeat protein